MGVFPFLPLSVESCLMFCVLQALVLYFVPFLGVLGERVSLSTVSVTYGPAMVWKYFLENSRNKQFVSFKAHAFPAASPSVRPGRVIPSSASSLVLPLSDPNVAPQALRRSPRSVSCHRVGIVPSPTVTRIGRANTVQLRYFQKETTSP